MLRCWCCWVLAGKVEDIILIASWLSRSKWTCSSVLVGRCCNLTIWVGELLVGVVWTVVLHLHLLLLELVELHELLLLVQSLLLGLHHLLHLLVLLLLKARQRVRNESAP